jgi:hypothetical protein
MVGPYQRLAAVSQSARIARFPDRACCVGESVWRVDRLDPNCATFKNETSACMIEFCGVRAALGVEVVGEVFTPKQCAADTRTCRGDRPNIQDA